MGEGTLHEERKFKSGHGGPTPRRTSRLTVGRNIFNFTKDCRKYKNLKLGGDQAYDC
jgi:hypothetical protein